MATIQDVARAAGVAASTVSRYLNGQLQVTPATEARLLDAVATLGYVPNVQAKNLARAPLRAPSASWCPRSATRTSARSPTTWSRRWSAAG